MINKPDHFECQSEYSQEGATVGWEWLMKPSTGHLPPSLGFYSGDWLLSLIIYKGFCGEFFLHLVCSCSSCTISFPYRLWGPNYSAWLAPLIHGTCCSWSHSERGYSSCRQMSLHPPTVNLKDAVWLPESQSEPSSRFLIRLLRHHFRDYR